MSYIKNKYYFIYQKKKYKIIDKGNNKKELFKNIKKKLNKKKIKDQTSFTLLILQNNKNKNSISKTGPIKVNIVFYKITKRGALKVNESDKRTNLIFYTKNFLEKNKIKNNDLRKIVKLAFNNKLEKRLFAPKLINQIYKVKI